MNNRNYLIIILIVILFAGCMKDKIESISDSVLVNSSYSLPIGTVIYSVNDYFEALDTINIPWPDSVAYNDTIYPNVLDIINKYDIKNFDFANLGGDNNKVKSITLHLIIQNGFPTEVRSQVYFTDNQFQTDSIFSGGMEIISPATLDQNGKVSEPNVQIRDILLPQNMINNLNNYTNIEIYGKVLTKRSDIKIVKFYPDYELRIHIGIRIELEYNLNEL